MGDGLRYVPYCVKAIHAGSFTEGFGADPIKKVSEYAAYFHQFVFQWYQEAKHYVERINGRIDSTVTSVRSGWW